MLSKALGLILNAVDMAEYCFFDKDNLRLYVWNGSLTVNIYGAMTGEAVDCFTMEGRREPYTVREVHDAIQEHIASVSG